MAGDAKRFAMTSAAPDKALAAVIAAGNAGSRGEFFFTLVNRSVTVCRYDRATLWQLSPKPEILAVSGSDDVDSRSSFVDAWSNILKSVKAPDVCQILSDQTLAHSAVWLPLRESCGMVLERWDGAAFSNADVMVLEQLAAGYQTVWDSAGKERTKKAGKGKLYRLAALVAVVLCLVFIRVPLRVVANCEVTARNPHLVAAPMDGVIDEILVAPGQRVEAGAALARYDSTLMEEELKISRRQVAVVEAELASARARGFSDARYRGQTAILEARLEQELARLEALEIRFSRRVVTAGTGGMVQLDNARAWRGRPVSTGQAILWLVDPEDTGVMLWLPQDDRVDFDLSRPVSVHLDAFGGESRQARLLYVSSFAQPTPGGGYAFPAEAEWLSATDQPPLGLQGSALVYGEEASLGYWLFRRPMAWLRRWLGI